MIIESEKLLELHKQYEKLDKESKIISIPEVKRKIIEILRMTEKLEDFINDQIDVLDNGCDDEEECDNQSELYMIYNEIESYITGGNLYKIFVMLSECKVKK